MKRITDKKIDALLKAISAIAEEVCLFEYGVPLHDKSAVGLMREEIRRWMQSLEGKKK